MNTFIYEGDAELSNRPFRQARKIFERQYFGEVLERAQGNVAQAAAAAGLHKRYFYEKIRQHELRFHGR